MATLGATLGVPLAASATTPTVPVLPDLSSLPVSNAGSIISELQALQTTTPGATLPSGSLSAVESGAESLVPTLSPVFSLLDPVLALNPPGPSYVAQMLGGLQSGTPSAALTELEAALETAGLGQLLNQGSAVTPAQISAALPQLAALQSLPLGGDVPAGGLSAVTAALGTIASSLTGAPQTGVQNAIATLGSGSVTPTQLETAVADLQSAAAAAPAPRGGANGVIAPLAAQLADASSVFGGLGSVGSPPSAATVQQALTELQSLPSLPAGGNLTGSSGLAQVGTILAAAAAQPGVPTLSAADLSSAASTLSNPSASLSPAQLGQLITTLQGASAGLPAPLGGAGGVVPSVAAMLAKSGTLAARDSTGSSPGSTSTGSTSAGSTNTTGTSSTGATTHTGVAGGAGKPKITTHSGNLRVTRVKRTGQRVSFTLTCTASRGRSCTGTVAASESGYGHQSHRVSLGGGARKTVTFTLRTRRGHAVRKQTRRRPVIHVVVRSGRYLFSRTLR